MLVISSSDLFENGFFSSKKTVFSRKRGLGARHRNVEAAIFSKCHGFILGLDCVAKDLDMEN